MCLYISYRYRCRYVYFQSLKISQSQIQGPAFVIPGSCIIDFLERHPRDEWQPSLPWFPTINVYICICIYVCTHAYTYIHTHTRACIQCTHTYLYTYNYMYTYTYNIYIYIYTHSNMCIHTYAEINNKQINRYIWYPPQRPRFSYINIQSGRWGSQSEIDGMGLRVGGFRV